jgi:hypothetical protein
MWVELHSVFMGNSIQGKVYAVHCVKVWCCNQQYEGVVGRNRTKRSMSRFVFAKKAVIQSTSRAIKHLLQQFVILPALTSIILTKIQE